MVGDADLANEVVKCFNKHGNMETHTQQLVADIVHRDPEKIELPPGEKRVFDECLIEIGYKLPELPRKDGNQGGGGQTHGDEQSKHSRDDKKKGSRKPGGGKRRSAPSGPPPTMAGSWSLPPLGNSYGQWMASPPFGQFGNGNLMSPQVDPGYYYSHYAPGFNLGNRWATISSPPSVGYEFGWNG